MNIAQILSTQAAAHPDAPALIDVRHGRCRMLSFADLEEASARAATLLRQAGLRQGDGVLVFHPMSAELYVALAAIFRLGLIAMFLDPAAGRAHIERCCQLRRPEALIASPRAHLLRLMSPAVRRIPVKFVVGLPLPGAVAWACADSLPADGTIISCEPDTPALLTFTSGSTGKPKAAVRTHGFLLAEHGMLERSLPLAPGSVDLATLPIMLLANLASGVTSVIPDADLRRPGAIDPVKVVAQIERHQVQTTVASPALLERLARHCAERGLVLPGLHRVVAGGAPVFPPLLDRLRQLAPNAEVVALYGSTEAEPIARIAREEMGPADVQAMFDGRGVLAGVPVAGVELRILADRWGSPIGPYTRAEFAAVRRAPGEAGEIVVSGGHVLSGYWRGHGDRETKFRVDGTLWHRTGDAGYLGADGRLWLLGRCAARIADSRGVLYPLAVECALSQIPEIRRAAVVAYGTRRLLLVEPWDGAGTIDLSDVMVRLEWAELDALQECARIPVDRRHNAKIDYPALYTLLDQEPTLRASRIPVRRNAPLARMRGV